MNEAQKTLVARPATELRRMIGSKEISPVELLEACIAQIEQVNPFLNAVTATCFDRARDEARAAERAVLDGKPLGLLHGLPLGVKDLEATAGLLTTYGSPLYRDNVPAEDNVLVARLRASGNPEEMSSAGRKQRFSAIHKILADDAEIRRLSQPWLEKLETFLGSRGDEQIGRAHV